MSDHQKEKAAAAANQRREDRHETFVNVVAVAGEQVDRTAFSGNISQEGMYVATPNILEVGTTVTLGFSVPGGHSPVEVDAEVAWTNESLDEETGLVPGFGVKFVDLDEEARSQIASYVKYRDEREKKKKQQ